MLLRIKHLLLLSLLTFYTGFALSQSNLVVNGDFEAGTSQWSTYFDTANGYNATFQTSTTQVYQGTASGEVIISSIGAAADYNKIMAKNTSFALTGGITYDVSFWVKSTSTQDFKVQIHEDSSPFTSYATHYFTPTNSWQEFTFSFTSPVTTSNVRFAFKLGNSVATYYFDNLSIAQQGPPPPPPPQVYTSLFDSTYTTDWSEAGIPGGIPDIPVVLNAANYGVVGDGITDNLLAFQNALNALQAGQALYVPSGTYLINGNLQLTSGQVIRGQCPSNTKLKFNVGQSDACIEMTVSNYGPFRPVASGYTKGSNTVEIFNKSGIYVGSYIQIQQDNNAALMYTDPAWNVSWAESSVGQLFQVLAINGNDVVLDREIYFGFDSAMSPEVRPLELVEEAGLENIYIERLDANISHTVEMTNVARCWMRNVESNMTYRSHVNVTHGLDIEIRESYFHDSHDYGSGGRGYGVNLSNHSTSCLVENNIFKTLRHAMLIQVGATGNVFGYNYSTNPYWTNSGIPPDISMHGHYPTMNLFEGNIVQEATYADYWGPVGPGNTMFRNRVEQSDIWVNDASHNQNVVANELTGGTNDININGTVMNTWYHSNDANGSIFNTCTAPVPASMYLDVFPEFLNGKAFPTLGYDVVGLNTIPAKDRFDSGIPMLTCLCYANIDCFDDCPVLLDDTHLGGGDPHIVLESEYYASDEIESSGTLKTGATIGYHANNEILLLPGFCTGDAQEFLIDLSGCP